MNNDFETLEKEFHEAMLQVYVNIGKETGYWAKRYRQKVVNQGGLAAAKSWLDKPVKEMSGGMLHLIKCKRIELSFEWLVTEDQWISLFEPRYLKEAYDRLDKSQRLIDHPDPDEDSNAVDAAISDGLLLTYAFLPNQQPASSWLEFVQAWKEQYNYTSKNPAYDLYILNRQQPFIFEAKHIRELYQWKNDMGDKFTEKKERTVEYIIANLPAVQQLSTTWDDEVFRVTFKKIGAVWQIFLMHIIQPDCFSIFDQHVYRASTHLKTGKGLELNEINTTQRKIALYASYQNFYNSIRLDSGCHFRDLDKALWAFGKYIKP